MTQHTYAPRISPEALQALQAAFGEHLSTAAATLAQHGRDESHPGTVPPEAVLFAQSEADVVAALRLADQYNFPVVAFGAGSSLEGQLIPVRGGLSLDVTGMNRLIEAAPGSFQATVQPGLTYPELNRQLRSQGVFFPVDPGAEATLGGMASTNASGTAAVKYGTTRDNILEMRVALLSGEVIRVGSKARKTSAGYDLKNLFVGAEGTLGIITELTVRLHPLPSELAVLRCHFGSIAEAARCAASIMGAALQPERLELIDEHEIHAVNLHKGTTYPEAPTLWIELSAPSRAALNESLELCQELCQEGGAQGLSTAYSAAERAAIWEARHHAYYALCAQFPDHERLNTDVCVPLHQVAALVEWTHARCEQLGIHGTIVGHVGDGNFHVLFQALPSDKAAWERIHATYDEMVSRALAVGGTCTGEHGVGLHKMRYLAQEHGDLLPYMRQLKAIFDPKGLLNPGKMFENH